MSGWYRPGDDGTSPHVVRYIVASAMSVGGLVPLCSGLVSDELGGIAVLPFALFTLIWQTVLWRTAMVGVWVSDRGVKIRWMTRTRVIPWPRVARVWAGQAADFDAWQVWLSTRDPDRDLETPIWRRGSPASRARLFRRPPNRIVLPPEEFSRALAELNRTG